jgi:monoterpene epsilon-lactone hydrolase
MELDASTGTLHTNAETDGFVQASVLQNMRFFYLPDGASGIDFKNPLTNPLYADAKGLPPMYLSAGSFETLLDNTIRFAEIVRKAGGSVQVDIKEGMQHVYPYMAGKHELSDQTLESIGKWVNEQFGK